MPARKRRAGRATEKAACAALRLRARSPAGVPLRFSPTGLSSRGLSVGPGFPNTAPNAADLPPTPPRSQRSTSRAGRSAGRHDARAAGVRSVSFRPRAPHSLRLQGVPPLKASFESEIGCGYCPCDGEVKRRRFLFDESARFARPAFRQRRSTRMILWRRSKC
jgi:hypothetical protein